MQRLSLSAASGHVPFDMGQDGCNEIERRSGPMGTLMSWHAGSRETSSRRPEKPGGMTLRCQTRQI